MATRVSDSGTRTKRYHSQLILALTDLERMFVEYYAGKYGKDMRQIIRGMIRKYIAIDDTFDMAEFTTWAEKVFIAQEEDKDTKARLKSQLKGFKEHTGELERKAG